VPQVVRDKGLSGMAKDIAAYSGARLRVVAGPGTGKSFALMRRLARLLEEGTPPSRILAVTFTRTAAADLRTDIDRLGITGCDAVEVTTLHGLCFGILKREAVLRSTGRAPRPLMKFEVDGLVHDLVDQAFGGVRDKRKRLLAYEANWARLQFEEPGWAQDPIDRQFQADVLEWMKFHKAMLVGELVPETRNHLRSTPLSPDLRRFDHVLVDEYQDLNKAEQDLVELLASGAKVTIVGDDDQSIYGFKYAHPDGILQYGTVHPDTHTETMTECRRCPQTVVQMASSLIQANQKRSAKALVSKAENPEGNVYLSQWPSLDDEICGVAQAIEHLVQKCGVPAGRILALAPRRLIGFSLREELLQRGVRARSLFHEDVLRDKQARERFVLLNLLASPQDRVALRAWFGLGGRAGYMALPYQVLRKQGEKTGQPPRAVLDAALQDGGLPRATKLLNRYEELLAQLTHLEGLSGRHLVNRLIPDENEATADLKELALLIADTHPEPADLFQELSRSISQPDPIPEGADVRIMSIHSSKGLTADAVFVLGCIEGLLPQHEAHLTPAELMRHEEEQRRLFYVALTRTKRILFLSYPYAMEPGLAARTGAELHGRGFRAGDKWCKNTQASRFLGQLGPWAPRPAAGNQALTTFLADHQPTTSTV
jgi:DNA helicase II / ATP-dependent DNA helicase PcrA